ncbi:MAG TPA: ferric reductase-like transmembrane domain-containing protein [Candidatus Limnocylindrales bacterium]|nr:ferric reductase-like transmembrane domain-containing protein [Candidatus Limnocylindrales bacterium]
MSRDEAGRAIDERWLHSLRHGYTDVFPVVEDRRSLAADWVDGHWSHDEPWQPRAVTGRTGRRILVACFWLVIATSLALWWVNTPAGSINDSSSVFLAIGRITGMVGGVVLLLQILSMSRVGWLERLIGAHDLMVWHRELGGYLLIMILTHMAATIVGYAAGAQVPILRETWSMVAADLDMVTATVATALLVVIALMSIRMLRRRMSYEKWYHLHLTSYLVVILGYGHQFSAGQELMQPGFGRVFWNGLYVFVAGCLLWGRVIDPLRLNLRHRLRIAQVVAEAPDMVSIYIGGRRLDALKARAGQYFRWRFLTRGRWWQAHPFSLSAAPNGEWLRLTVKMVGDHTRGLAHLREGARIFAEGPSGVFTADRSVRMRALLIAGGSGVAPIRALLEDLPRGTIMIYRARSADELLFREELEWLAWERGAFIWFVLGGRDEPGPRNLFTPKGLQDLVPDVTRRDIFLCGPPSLVEASVKVLRRLRIPWRQIHLDPFEF